MVHIRANSWRGLKDERHKRRVPLWPDLQRVLYDYVTPDVQRDELLFPSSTGRMLKDIRGSLSSALRKAKIKKAVTLHSLRHSCTATRLQTLDHGAPVSLFTVARELGHRSVGLIESTYGHLTTVTHRGAVVEYRRTEVLPLSAGIA